MIIKRQNINLYRGIKLKFPQSTEGKSFSSLINHTSVFLGHSPKSIDIKAKINKWDLIKLKLLHSKENNKQNEKTTPRMGENICK